MRDDFERVLCGPRERGLYESNYLKANEPGGQGALWIKYNLMAPAGAALPRSAELWALYWPRPGQRPTVVRQVILGHNVETSSSAVEIRSELASLTAAEAHGALESGGHRIAWDLTLTGDDPPIYHAPHRPMYTLPVPSKKLMTPRPRLEMSGTVAVDGAEVVVDRWVGLRGHNWGSAHPHSYAFCTANLWQEPGRWAFEGYTGRIHLGSMVSPWLSAAVLRLDKEELPLNSLRRWLNRSARVEFPSWSVTFGDGSGTRLDVRCTLDPEELAGLIYLSPSGRVGYCYSTKFAHLELHLERSGRAPETKTSRCAELEFLSPDPIAGIPLYGEETLPR